jgi:hypothetical protein
MSDAAMPVTVKVCSVQVFAATAAGVREAANLPVAPDFTGYHFVPLQIRWIACPTAGLTEAATFPAVLMAHKPSATRNRLSPVITVAGVVIVVMVDVPLT